MEQTKQCSKCKELKGAEQFSRKGGGRVGTRSICRRCNSAGAHEWNKQNPGVANGRIERWRKENREKFLVSKGTRKALKEGIITKSNACEACGRDDARLHGHHDDYSKPLEVRWLCASCHQAHHKAMDRGEQHEIVRID